MFIKVKDFDIWNNLSKYFEIHIEEDKFPDNRKTYALYGVVESGEIDKLGYFNTREEAVAYLEKYLQTV